MDSGFHVIFKRCRFKGGLFKNVNVQAGAKMPYKAPAAPARMPPKKLILLEVSSTQTFFRLFASFPTIPLL